MGICILPRFFLRRSTNQPKRNEKRDANERNKAQTECERGESGHQRKEKQLCAIVHSVEAVLNNHEQRMISDGQSECSEREYRFDFVGRRGFCDGKFSMRSSESMGIIVLFRLLWIIRFWCVLAGPGPYHTGAYKFNAAQPIHHRSLQHISSHEGISVKQIQDCKKKIQF